MSQTCSECHFGFELVAKRRFTISSHDSMLYKFLPKYTSVNVSNAQMGTQALHMN